MESPAHSALKSRIHRRLRRLLDRPPGRDPVIDGVRAIAILWVALLHVFFFHFGTFPDEILGVFAGSGTQWIRQGVLGVDLFFVISGYLIGSILLGEHARTGGIAVRRFYARRFVRLVPVYAVAMALAAPLLQDVPTSAMLKEIPPSGNVENAWANLLYVNNLLPVDRQYMPWCWSLAIEEQFYLVAPVFLLFLLERARRPLVWMGALLAASSLIRFAVVQRHGILPPLAANPADPEWARLFDTIYDKPHVRYGGLLTGLVGAYVSLHHLERLKGWVGGPLRSTVILSACAAVIGLVACTSFESPGFDSLAPSVAQALFAAHRDVFAVAVLCALLVVMHGRGSLSSLGARCLSWRLLYPIAQLSYTGYLVHEAVMIFVFPKTAPLLAGAG